MLAAAGGSRSRSAAAIAGRRRRGRDAPRPPRRSRRSRRCAIADVTTAGPQLLSGVEVELSAELGRTDLALGDITSLAADSVLTLDQIVDEPVTVFVNGTRYATARLVVVDGEYGIEILEVVEQAAVRAPRRCPAALDRSLGPRVGPRSPLPAPVPRRLCVRDRQVRRTRTSLQARPRSSRDCAHAVDR